MKISKFLCCNLSYLLILAITSMPALAESDADTIELTVTGTLTKPTCTLNSSKTLIAAFGSMRSDEIEKSDFVNVPITLDCPQNSSVNVSVTSSNIHPGSHIFGKTSTEGLFYMMIWSSDNTVIDITGTEVVKTGLSGTVDMSIKVKLTSIGTSLPAEGDFTASAIINFEYI